MLPRRNVYAEALGEWSALGGPFIRGEVGGVLMNSVGGYIAAEKDAHDTKVFGGVRVTF